MSLPPWDDDWEKPNPLRCKGGWARPHYASIGVAAVLVATALGVSAPAVARVRDEDSRVRRIDEYRQQKLGGIVLALLQQR